MFRLIAALASLLLLLPSIGRTEVTLPAQGDWTDHGTLFSATGVVGDWNREYAGVAPCDVILKDEVLYLYYIGSDGDRQFDQGPRHRRLGLATCPTTSDCTNGANWTQEPSNPILDHRPNLDTPNDEWGEEEGVWTCSVLDEGDGNYRLYFGAMTNAPDPQSVIDQGKVVSSTDLTSWPDGVSASTKVLDNACPGLWGCGDELDPLTVFKIGSTYHYIYQVGTGTSPVVSWGLGYVTGTSFNAVDTGTSAEWKDAPASPEYRGNCNDVRISSTQRAVFCDAWANADLPPGHEIYVINDSAPGTAGSIQDTYSFAGVGESTVFMDESKGLWYMFYRDRDVDLTWGLGSTIRVKTAPVVGSTGLLSGGCTWPNDCYSNCVENDDGTANDVPASCTADNATCFANASCQAKGIPIDHLLWWSEDFESPSLISTDTTYVGAGPPTYGPWWDSTGDGPTYTEFMGWNSYWNRNYAWGNTTCSSPAGATGTGAAAGTNCDAGTNCAAPEWANQFGMGGFDPCIHVWTGTDASSCTFDDELAGNGIPDSPGTDDNRCVWDGKASMAARIPAGAIQGLFSNENEDETLFPGIPGQDSNINVKTTKATAVTSIGVTYMQVYSDNIQASGIWDFPWKHEEWFDTWPTDAGFWPVGNTGCNPAGEPLDGILWTYGNEAAALASQTARLGSFCEASPGFTIGFNPGVQPTWNDGDWGCVRWDALNMGTSNTTFRIWFNDTLIFDADIDGTLLSWQGINGMVFNSFANANQGSGGETPTTQVVRRGYDNWHVREGPSVTCAQISGTPQSAAPPAQPGFEGGGFSIAMTEPTTEGGGTQPVRSLQFCDITVQEVGGQVLHQERVLASAPAGGGVHNFTIDAPCDTQINTTATCTNDQGESLPASIARESESCPRFPPDPPSLAHAQ